MVSYTCDTCAKEFPLKGLYNLHKARKTECCAPVETKVQQEELVKPFLKWVGGKTQILDEVLTLFPKEMCNYHEPFLGGGSVLLALLTHVSKGSIKLTGRVYASDLNSNLIGLYKNIQSETDTLIIEVKKLVDEFEKCKGTVVNRKPTSISAESSPETYYYWIRSRFNLIPDSARSSVSASAMLLFMNKTCFRGVYREGPNGFNVPFGHYKNPSIIDEAHIKKVATLVKDVVFTNSSFTESVPKAVSGDFVYLDPPYAPVNAASFVSYNKEGFDKDNHTALFKLCGEMKSKDVKMLMSNAAVKTVTDAFPAPYTTKIISCKRSIHSKDPGVKVNEVLIDNYIRNDL